jgi:hypothetical protein
MILFFVGVVVALVAFRVYRLRHRPSLPQRFPVPAQPASSEAAPFAVRRWPESYTAIYPPWPWI